MKVELTTELNNALEDGFYENIGDLFRDAIRSEVIKMGKQFVHEAFDSAEIELLRQEVLRGCMDEILKNRGGS